MKVVVTTNTVPFLRGGAEHLADSLVDNLRLRGHQAELIRLPFRWGTPTEVATSMAAAAATRVPNTDLVVPLKFPAWLVPHENTVPWVLHQFRQVYDMWEPDRESDAQAWSELRRMVKATDDDVLSACRRVYCNSSITAERMLRYNGVEPTVLLPPHGDADAFRTESYEPFLLATGRITATKRQHLLLEALARTTTGWRLVIAGKPEHPSDLTRLRDLITAHGLEDRVDLVPEFIDDATKVDLLSRARAVAYLPLDEDSYGYVTLEAMLSRKAVLTTSDAGGILQLVHHDRTGMVAEPDASSLAEAMSRLMDDVEHAERLGSAARVEAEALDLSWDTTVRRLLS